MNSPKESEKEPKPQPKNTDDLSKIANLFNDKINNLEKMITELVKKPEHTVQTNTDNISKTSSQPSTNPSKEKFKEQVWEKLKEKYLLDSSLNSLSDNEKALKEYLDINLKQQHSNLLKELDLFNLKAKEANDVLTKKLENELTNNIKKAFSTFKESLQKDIDKEIKIHNKDIKKTIDLLESHYSATQENIEKLKSEISNSIKTSDLEVFKKEFLDSMNLEDRFKNINSEIQDVEDEILNLNNDIKTLTEENNSFVPKAKFNEFENEFSNLQNELETLNQQNNSFVSNTQFDEFKNEIIKSTKEGIENLNQQTDLFVSNTQFDEFKNTISNLQNELKTLNQQNNLFVSNEKFDEFKDEIIKSTKEDIETSRWLLNQEKTQNEAKIQKELSNLKAEFLEYLDIISALDKKTENLVSDKKLEEMKSKLIREVNKRNDQRYLKTNDLETVLDTIFDKKDEIL
ncbi:hypothetical protein ELUMI_v1c06660 [Williamsoniiplasma luminosum]|uniref:Uncharacterized protein n=1 Tax=Williamsoniiplasma luminosum TaxID=214888 RepID=A0A2K8NW14_9MOLU|nr:hypothetical protein [Williamsoniiplasma luminosum]ATZ17388.1 hypothetical protein ELUMI_v1c06660 [Williamsoniiplasma luminosum]